MRRKKQTRKASMVTAAAAATSTRAAGAPLIRDESHDSSLSGVEKEKRGWGNGARETRSGV